MTYGLINTVHRNQKLEKLKSSSGMDVIINKFAEKGKQSAFLTNRIVLRSVILRTYIK